jgi:hypothetical protein
MHQPLARNPVPGAVQAPIVLDDYLSQPPFGAANRSDALPAPDEESSVTGKCGGTPRPLGPLQLRLLDALRHHRREASLGSLAALAAGLIPDLGDARLPAHRGVSPARYSAVARAVAALRRRGLIETRMAGSTRGRMTWLPAPDGRRRPVWQFRNPTRRLHVKLAPAL